MTGVVTNPTDPNHRQQLRVLVDTGAFFSLIPREVLSALKVSPTREETVQFADGRRKQWKVGEVRLEINGRSATTLVFFGRETKLLERKT